MIKTFGRTSVPNRAAFLWSIETYSTYLDSINGLFKVTLLHRTNDFLFSSFTFVWKPRHVFVINDYTHYPMNAKYPKAHCNNCYLMIRTKFISTSLQFRNCFFFFTQVLRFLREEEQGIIRYVLIYIYVQPPKDSIFLSSHFKWLFYFCFIFLTLPLQT